MQNLLNFIFAFFRTYDITTELVMLVLVGVLYLIILATKPERSYMLNVFHTGMVFSLLTMIFHIRMLGATIRYESTDNLFFVNLYYILFAISYTGVMETIFLYQSNLAYKRRLQRKYTCLMGIVFGIIWLGLMLYPVITNNLLVRGLTGKIIMSKASDMYVVCGFTCSLLIGIVSIFNRKDVSKIINYGSAIFIPIEAVSILMQFHFHTAYFICATFTLPFIIYYIYFHANKFNDVTGCQGHSAYRSHLKKFISAKKDFLTISISCPLMENRNNTEIHDVVIEQTNLLARKIEKFNNKIRVYSVSMYHYKILCPVRDEFEAEYLERKIIDVLTEPVIIGEKYVKVPMNFLVATRYEEIESCEEMLVLMHFKEKKFTNQGIDQIIRITEEDAKKYKRYEFLEKNIMDIKFCRNMNDERVMVMIQPIYSIKDKVFKTGESLMRLKINGEIIYPDEFIPIAEHCGCIHALTRIMLFKVAKLTTKFRNNSSFEALTVNVSTVEMMEPNVCEEFYGLIKRAGANPENIRLEITESTQVMDYKKVMENVQQLVDMGFKFYLDDFGTGYSNLDRVIGMPFSTVKFDKCLLYKAQEDKKTAELFKFLADFFKSKGFSLVVEGVEDETQRDYVTETGFDYIQGYLYSKPVPAAEVEKFFLQDGEL